MSARRNPKSRVSVTDHNTDIGPLFSVSLDGDELTTIRYGKQGNVEFGEGEVTRDAAESLANLYASVLAKSLPKAPVILTIPAQVYVYVTGEKVTEVHIVPSQQTIDSTCHWNTDEEFTDDEVEAAAKVADTECWDPLLTMDQSKGLVWEA